MQVLGLATSTKLPCTNENSSSNILFLMTMTKQAEPYGSIYETAAIFSSNNDDFNGPLLNNFPDLDIF